MTKTTASVVEHISGLAEMTSLHVANITLVYPTKVFKAALLKTTHVKTFLVSQWIPQYVLSPRRLLYTSVCYVKVVEVWYNVAWARSTSLPTVDDYTADLVHTTETNIVRVMFNHWLYPTCYKRYVRVGILHSSNMLYAICACGYTSFIQHVIGDMCVWVYFIYPTCYRRICACGYTSFITY